MHSISGGNFPERAGSPLLPQKRAGVFISQHGIFVSCTEIGPEKFTQQKNFYKIKTILMLCYGYI
jgi:hypothetical protein